MSIDRCRPPSPPITRAQKINQSINQRQIIHTNRKHLATTFWIIMVQICCSSCHHHRFGNPATPLSFTCSQRDDSINEDDRTAMTKMANLGLGPNNCDRTGTWMQYPLIRVGFDQVSIHIHIEPQSLVCHTISRSNLQAGCIRTSTCQSHVRLFLMVFWLIAVYAFVHTLPCIFLIFIFAFLHFGKKEQKVTTIVLLLKMEFARGTEPYAAT